MKNDWIPACAGMTEYKRFQVKIGFCKGLRPSENFSDGLYSNGVSKTV